ncbi:polysaccharide pyruvyl transferase family protein [Olivibacter sp. XZL3]|uniref:polysaccharide pyruvyl transferase family protein n=1 Tax=Olivibacter sp. XZL3 TaxID=1735116 RepID=UPI001065B7FB|nr:polysaccharide pyruvyl transferase family protein [Olivibacter sp. XZL3]
MNKILIIGAFDRFNYGDLLFPIIIEQQLKTYGQPLDLAYFGMVDSDLSDLGGKPTQNIQAFYQACNDGSTRANIIVAGGEAIAVTWNSLLVALNEKYKLIRRYQHHLEKFMDLNKWAKRKLKGQTMLPFVFNKTDFKSVDHVLFNSLGGSEIPEEIFTKVEGLKQKLKNVDYFSVRDTVTQQNLKDKGIDTNLYPDSAILMSKFYPNEQLQGLVSIAIKRFVEEKKGKYVFFQINRNHAKQKEERIASLLNAIYEQTGTDICLCPIGKASNHNDDEALQLVFPHLKGEAQFFNEVTVWDIMYLIANARCYIGTSLHGAITAMSYAIPYVGINVKKLNSYLSTWGVERLKAVVPIEQLFTQYQIAIDVPKQDLLESKRRQFAAIEESFDRMATCLFGT